MRDVILGGITTRNTDFLRMRCLDLNAVLANLCKSNGYKEEIGIMYSRRSVGE